MVPLAAGGFWDAAHQSIDDTLKLVRQSIDSGDVEHISPFAIAPIPLLIYLPITTILRSTPSWRASTTTCFSSGTSAAGALTRHRPTSERTLFLSMSVGIARQERNRMRSNHCCLLPDRSHGHGTRCTRKG
jgi:hypothetical protein